MKKLSKTYRIDVVDGKLVCSVTQSKAPTIEISTPAPPTKECRQCKKAFTPGSLRGAPQVFCTVKCRTKYHNQKNSQRHKSERKEAYEGRVCPQCSTKLEYQSRGRSKKFCTAKCREEWFNNKYKQERKERLAKASARTFPCRLCKREAVKKKGNQVYCSLDCRESYYSKTFVTEVNKALSLLPPEKTLPPIPEDTSAASLLAAGRTLTPLGLVEAVQDIYGIDVAEERPRPKAFWFAILLARHSKTLEEWKKLLGKHGMLSNPKIEKWLLFRAGASSAASAGRLKAQLGI